MVPDGAAFKYARYFDAEGRHSTEYEMYDLPEDAHELENLAHSDNLRYAEPDVSRERDRLAAKLERIEQQLAGPAWTNLEPRRPGLWLLGFARLGVEVALGCG
jgi:hypothetical protein